MSVPLWILLIVLTLAFLASGGLKLTQPKESLRERMRWVESFSSTQIKAIGGLEVLGALGLILPAVAKTAHWLIPTAALGLTAMMIGASITHIRIKDPISQVVPSAVLGVLSLVLALFV